MPAAGCAAYWLRFFPPRCGTNAGWEYLQVLKKFSYGRKITKSNDDDESGPDEYDLDNSFLNDDEDVSDVSDGDSDWGPSDSQSQKVGFR